MKRVKSSSSPEVPSTDGAPHAVSLRAMYADAMREVMADPRKAIAEHDPWLATLMGARLASSVPGKR